MRGARGTRMGLAIAGLTLLAIVLRVVAFGDGVYGDDLYNVDDTHGDLGGVFDGISRNEVTPPLFYVVAWAFAQLGHAVTLLRAPSILLGSATVPLTYLLGRKLAGPRVGLLAALLVAISPFAIFYGTEARPYAMAMFFTVLGALALLRALETDGGVGWWVLYGFSVLAAMYAHYMTVWVIVGVAIWAVATHRDRVRPLAITLGVVALAYLPWFPTVLDQRGNDLSIAAVGINTRLTLATALEYPVKLVAGHPFRRLPVVPGSAWIPLLVAGGALLAAVTVPRIRRPGLRVDRRNVTFVAVLALATPGAVLVYSLLADDLYTPRNLSMALPGLAIGIAWAVTALRPRLGVAAALLIVVPVAAGAAKGLEHENRRPDSPAVARYLERNARPGDAVVTGIGDVGALPIYLHGHDVRPEDDPAVWRAAAHGRAVFLVRGEVGGLPLLPSFAGPAGRYELGAHVYARGLRELAVGRYTGPVTAQVSGHTIQLSTGRRIVVTPGVVRGAREDVAGAAGTLTVAGWAIGTEDARPVDSIFVMDGSRCLGVATPNIQRADVAAGLGAQAGPSGFRFQTAAADAADLAASGHVRLYGVVGDRASELPAP